MKVTIDSAFGTAEQRRQDFFLCFRLGNRCVRVRVSVSVCVRVRVRVCGTILGATATQGQLPNQLRFEVNSLLRSIL